MKTKSRGSAGSVIVGIIAVVAVILIAGCVWFVSEARKPAIVAKVEFTKTTLTLTNGNDQPWRNAVVILNEAFDGPRANIPTIGPGEHATFQLNGFVGLLNKQRFNPEFERVHQVIIQADGFSLGSYTK